MLSHFFKSSSRPGDAHGKNVATFLTDLIAIAPPAGRGHYNFKSPSGETRGFVQLICFERLVQIHRVWAIKPGTGSGSIMMQTLCDLADRHSVEMKLKVIPIGRKPFPMSREQLKVWYQRFGFAGSRWTLIRKPLAQKITKAVPTSSQSAI